MGGIVVNTAVNQITAEVQGPGGITVTQTGDATLASLTTWDGPIDVTVTGSMTVEDVRTGLAVDVGQGSAATTTLRFRPLTGPLGRATRPPRPT